MTWSFAIEGTKSLEVSSGGEFAVVSRAGEYVVFASDGERGRVAAPDFDPPPEDSSWLEVADNGRMILHAAFLASHAGDVHRIRYVAHPGQDHFVELEEPDAEEFGSFGDEERAIGFLDRAGEFLLMNIEGFELDDGCPICARYDFTMDDWTSFVRSGGEDVTVETLMADGSAFMALSELDLTLAVGDESETWEFGDGAWSSIFPSGSEGAGYAIAGDEVWRFEIGGEPRVVFDLPSADAEFAEGGVLRWHNGDNWEELRLIDGARRTGTGVRATASFRLEGEVLHRVCADVDWGEWSPGTSSGQ